MAATSSAASGIVLEPLTRYNYENWSTLVMNYLMGQGLWQIVNSAPRIWVPSKGENDIWEMKNAKALHIIQLASGSEALTHLRGIKTAKEAWSKLRWLYDLELETYQDIEQGILDDSFCDNKPLHWYVLNGEWNDAKLLINNKKDAIFSTSSSGRTVLHLAIIAGLQNIVEELVKLGKDHLVKMTDECGYTALHLAAELSDNTKIAKLLVESSETNKISGIIGQDLLCMETKDGEIPVLLAAAKAHKRMTRYLYRKTPIEVLESDNFRNGDLLLTRCLTTEIFDVALGLIQRFQQLPLDHVSRDLQLHPLYLLACLPSAFPSGNEFGLLQHILYNILRLKTPRRKLQGISTFSQDKGNRRKSCLAGRFCGRMLNFLSVKLLGRNLLFIHMLLQNSILVKLPGVREIYDKKMTHHQALEILTCLSLRIQEFDESQLKEASAYDAMLQAAKHGIIEFIAVMSKASPKLLWAIDKNKRDILSHAIMNRRKEVFRLIYGAFVDRGREEIIKGSTDVFGNTLLHLAGDIWPSSYVDHISCGPFLQMQREIRWFQAVERIVHPKCKELKNKEGKKPHEVFTESHKELVKAGEKWAKESARQFIAVGTIITTITFAAALTVPGGNNQNDDKKFGIFIASDAISLFTSSISVFIFIGVLTWRYGEKDFSKNLAYRFLFGLIFLFVSVVSMIVAFCASLVMILKGHQLVKLLTVSIGSVPVILLVTSQLRLLREIFNSTRRSI